MVLNGVYEYRWESEIEKTYVIYGDDWELKG